jgi:hypothetical protein
VEGALGPGAADDTLSLFLLPARRPGHRFTGAEDDATAAAVVVLKGICPRGNNKVVIILFRVHNRCLFLMLELY